MRLTKKEKDFIDKSDLPDFYEFLIRSGYTIKKKENLTKHNNDFKASAIKEIHTDSLDGLENETQKYLDKELIEEAKQLLKESKDVRADLRRLFNIP